MTMTFAEALNKVFDGKTAVAAYAWPDGETLRYESFGPLGMQLVKTYKTGTIGALNGARKLYHFSQDDLITAFYIIEDKEQETTP